CGGNGGNGYQKIYSLQCSRRHSLGGWNYDTGLSIRRKPMDKQEPGICYSRLSPCGYRSRYFKIDFEEKKLFQVKYGGMCRKTIQITSLRDGNGMVINKMLI